MQNQRHSTWPDGFVPVKGSWDLNMERNTPRACPAANQGVGMVGAVMQTLEDTYAPGKALRAGTLFPALNMPLNGYDAPAGSCGDAAQESAFAAWEMRLFLNTHPHDREALKMFRRLRQQAGEKSYATAFLPEENCGETWGWGNAPWPWEYPRMAAERAVKEEK